MTLDEAIYHAKEKARELRAEANQYVLKREGKTAYVKASNAEKYKGCRKCAKEHDQLSDWLTELNDIRVVVKNWQDGKINDDMPMLKAFSRIVKIIEESEAEHEESEVEND